MKKLLLPLLVGLSLSATAMADNTSRISSDDLIFTNSTSQPILVTLETEGPSVGPVPVFPFMTQFIDIPDGDFTVSACYQKLGQLACTSAGSTDCPQSSPNSVIATGSILLDAPPNLKCISNAPAPITAKK